jgi:hypothetical protein
LLRRLSGGTMSGIARRPSAQLRRGGLKKRWRE